MEATKVLERAMRDTGPWYGVNGTRNKYAYDVLFAALQHLTVLTNPRAAQWLQNRVTVSSVLWLERGQ